MNVEDIEFLAEKSPVKIIPNSHSQKFQLISGDYGPLTRGCQCTVPLWVAVYLKQQGNCYILCPPWMKVDALQDIIQAERRSKNFTKIPSYDYMIVAKILLKVVTNEIPDYWQVKTLIKDLWDLRQTKIRTSVDALIRSGQMAATVNNLTNLELDTLRPLLPSSMSQVIRFRHSENSATQSQNNTTMSLINSP